jgi:DNA modification methylase/predicted RNA-binding Zn-ribbon protein involved in translation (DUF1610 family)
MGPGKTTDTVTQRLFPDAQGHLFEKSFQEELEEQRERPVECLGMTFSNDEERRKHFLDDLREKLKDPEFRKIEGFPIGSDEDILALSDPPYYTACPNPFISDFIKHYGKPYNPSAPYSREPFAVDVSEGKNDPIYLAHSYHTKVPYKAIIRYILHYTEPGDVVFDGFCGTGMTGVAAQMCGDKAVVESLGYRVENDGIISQQETDENGTTGWKPFSKLGARLAILNDLSPAATFIAYNFNTPVDVEVFERTAKHILKDVEDECGWMYETLHTDGKKKGRINYVIWSDVFICPECTGDVVFWRAAINNTTWQVNDTFFCPNCNTSLSKGEMGRAFETIVDKDLGTTIRRAKQIPVLIHYYVNNAKHLKQPDAFDFALLSKVDSEDIPYLIPIDELPDGYNTRQPKGSHGITHVHHFYTRRNLWALAAFSAKQGRARNTINVSSVATAITKMYRFRSQGGSLGAGGGPQSGILYIPSLSKEIPITKVIGEHITKWLSVHRAKHGFRGAYVSTGSASSVPIRPANSVDYMFIDPPFGGNLMYSELNFLWEAWLKVFTNNSSEAIENTVQGKGLDEYRHIMTACFKDAYRVLKPGRWMTVEFSNTRASVWNSIQTALTEAGFIVANVSALDKQQNSFKAVTTLTAVKQDLVISAYKPNGGFEDRFQKEASTEAGVWDFVRTHLRYLPVIKRGASTRLIAVTERDPRILYDQMVAYFVRNGYPVPLDSTAFQEGLSMRFSYRDGMYFLPEQVVEYDKKKLTAGGIEQASLFISDESSAIAWLRQLLKDKPQTFQDINPQFIRELGGWQKYERSLELSELLEQNFLRYEGRGEVPSQIHSYLSTNFRELRNLPKDDESLRAKGKDRWYVPDPNKAGDLEKLREKALLKEFEEYRTSSQKRLKVFRLEALRAGFKKAWQEKSEAGYRTIIEMARRIPDDVLQEDPKLLMWYDQAVTRQGEDT